MGPLHEPSKPSKNLRYLIARAQKDQRFNQLVNRIKDIAVEFLAPASMVQGAADVVAHAIRRADYISRQHAAFKADQNDDAEAV
jgi:hypothetical protein